MPRMNIALVAIPANGTTLNLLAGLSYEFLGQEAQLVVAAVAAATGVNCTLLVANGITVVDDQPISTANRFPILPDDILFQDYVPAGRLLLRFRNTTGAPINLSGAVVDVTF
jgi:hypothetical protein